MSLDAGALERIFRDLFSALRRADYFWEPLTPDRLLACRRTPEAFGALVRYFGLGLEVGSPELEDAGIGPALLAELEAIRPAVSRCGDYFIAHSHWARDSGRHAGEYVYLGQESFDLLRRIQSERERFEGRKVLDLGSGSGILAFEVAPSVERVLGIEASVKAVSWATASARAQEMGSVSFVSARIGTPEADAAARGTWDIAIANPPFAIPGAFPRLHRDGGDLGIEIPLGFLEFAWRHLEPRGEVFCLATNPVISGKSVFFDRLDGRKWDVLGKRRLNDHFNHELARKEGYSGLGIDRIELWFLHLQKN